MSAEGSFVRSEGLAAGISRGRVDGPRFVRPFYGLRMPQSAVLPDDELALLIYRCHVYAPRLRPGQFFSHSTALALMGVPVPSYACSDIHISAHRPQQAPRLREVFGHRLQPRSEQVKFQDGLPVLAPAASWVQVLERWHHDALVVAADHIVAPHNSLASIESLRDAAERARKVARATRVLVDVREGSESPQETRLRLRLLRAGLPEPELGFEIRDASGGFIARLDLAFPKYRVAVEYDGRQHATDAAQFERDADRWYEIRGEGWELVRVLSHHLNQEEGRVAVDRIRAALRQRGWPG